MDVDRVVRSLHAVLPRALDFSTALEPPGEPDSKSRWDAVVHIAGQKVTVEWLTTGTLPAVRKVLARHPRPDVLVTPKMSEGAKAAASDAGIGWVEETGAAEIALPFLVVSRTAVAQPPTKPKRWRSSHLGVTEALLEGIRPTVSAVTEATGMPVSTVTEALAFLTSEGLLDADAARGRKSARQLNDPAALLDSYASAVETLPPTAEIQVGILPKDPIRDIARIGKVWSNHHVTWAATSAVAAATLAPFATQVAPLVVYVDADTSPQLASIADLGDLSPIRGGRLTLRPFPTKATAKLCRWHDGLSIVPWARCYADLVTTGVRGEEIATNLRETKLSERRRTSAES